MNCQEFLDNYSDYLDRRLEIPGLAEYGEHLRECRSCGEYDRVMHRGLHLIRELEPPESTPDFATNLRSNIFAVQDSLQGNNRPLTAALTVATLAASLLFIVAALPVFSGNRDVMQLPPVVVDPPVRSSASVSLWGPAPTFRPATNLLLVPNLSDNPLRAIPPERLSLFRTPLPVAGPTRPADPPPEVTQEVAE